MQPGNAHAAGSGTTLQASLEVTGAFEKLNTSTVVLFPFEVLDFSSRYSKVSRLQGGRGNRRDKLDRRRGEVQGKRRNAEGTSISNATHTIVEFTGSSKAPDHFDQ